MTTGDLDQDARLADGNLADRVVDSHEVTVKALGRLVGKLGQSPLGQGDVRLVAEPDEFAMAWMGVTTGPAEEHALSPSLGGERIGGDNPDGMLDDLHVNTG